MIVEECALELVYVVVKLESILKRGLHQKIERVQCQTPLVVELLLQENILVTWDVFGFK
tara:strand:+ start:919 stop:1095 length:177 start_codon:yes stop_codon:yes gene_type:complete